MLHLGYTAKARNYPSPETAQEEEMVLQSPVPFLLPLLPQTKHSDAIPDLVINLPLFPKARPQKRKTVPNHGAPSHGPLAHG